MQWTLKCLIAWRSNNPAMPACSGFCGFADHRLVDGKYVQLFIDNGGIGSLQAEQAVTQQLETYWLGQPQKAKDFWRLKEDSMKARRDRMMGDAQRELEGAEKGFLVWPTSCPPRKADQR